MITLRGRILAHRLSGQHGKGLCTAMHPVLLSVGSLQERVELHSHKHPMDAEQGVIARCL
jgi:hypothetical protein